MLSSVENLGSIKVLQILMISINSYLFFNGSQLVVTTLQIGSYSGLDSSPYGIPSGNHIEDRPVYLVYYRET